VVSLSVLVYVFGPSAVVNGQNQTPSLHMAAARGEVDLINQYIEKKADLNAMDNYGYTPLKRAVDSGHLEAVKALLQGGANPNVKDRDGSTVLLLAAQSGQKDIVEALLAAKADANAKNSAGQTSLHLAVMMGNIDVTESLLAGGADVNATTAGGQTALGMAQQRGGMPELEDLLKKHGGTVPTVDPRLGPYGDYGAPGQQATPSQSRVPAGLVIDPNEILKDLAKFTALDAPLKVIDANSESEQRAWIVRRSDNRTLLIRAVQKQFDEEMKFVKHLAVEENAAKTTKAVDDLVAARKTRYEQIGQQLRDQRRQTLAETRETTAAAGGRTTGTRGMRGRTGTTGRSTVGQDPVGTTGQQARTSRRSTAQQPALSADTQAQIQAWLNGTTENKPELLTATHELDLVEYSALSTLAQEEKAEKTRVGIMALLMFREQRIAKIVVKWQEEEERMQRMQERTGTDPMMQGTQQGIQQGTRRGGRR